MRTYRFVEQDNCKDMLKAVLFWLKEDYEARGKPSGHFWNNAQLISEKFRDNKAMVAFADDEMIGFMVWSMSSPAYSTEIDIVEVKVAHRRQGVFSAMQDALQERFDRLQVLTARVIPDAVESFDESPCWERGGYSALRADELTPFYKPLRQFSPPLEAPPAEGYALAVVSKFTTPSGPEFHYVDAYRVDRESDLFAPHMRYYPLDLDDAGKLVRGVVAPYHYEGYVGLYRNGKLINVDEQKSVSGKARHLLDSHENRAGLLILGEIQLRAEYRCDDTDIFFSEGDAELGDDFEDAFNAMFEHMAANATLVTTTSTATTVLLEDTQSTLGADTPENDDDAVIAAPPVRSGSASPVGIFRADGISKTQTKSASVSPQPELERRKPESHKRTADGDGDPGPDRKMRKFGS